MTAGPDEKSVHDRSGKGVPASFEEDYFENAYFGEYEKRNPERKLLYYLNEILDVRGSGSLLDAGCAYGLFLSRAVEHFKVAGCDVSAHAVERARAALPGVTVLQSGIEELKTGMTFDIVTCFDILEHVAALDTAFENIRTLLNDEGVVVVTVPVYDTPAGWLVGMLDRDKTHIWKKSRGFWKDKLRDHGFTLIKSAGLWRYSLAGHYLFFGGKIWNFFSPAVLLIGRKNPAKAAFESVEEA